jgi:hypothetical protein
LSPALGRCLADTGALGVNIPDNLLALADEMIE